MLFRAFLVSVFAVLSQVLFVGCFAQADFENCKGFGAGVTDQADCKFVGEGDGMIDVAQGGDTTLEGAGTSLIKTVNNVINYALGLLALITLVILIYGGFVMLFSFNDDAGYKKGFTILKNAAIALIFIGLAWILVRFIFFVIDFISK